MRPKIIIADLEFEQFLALSAQEILMDAKIGMREAVEAWKDDAMNVIPKVPVKSGWLKGHHRTRLEKGLNIIGVLETYDTIYAATVHSGLSRHGTPISYTHAAAGEGSHWISTKLYKYDEKYFAIIQLRLL